MLAAASLFAEAAHKVEANVPFAFHVGEKVFPAGRYTVDVFPSNLLLVRMADSSQSTAILTSSAGSVTKSTKATLVFNRYGDQYFLFQVWTTDDYVGRELYKTKRELRQAKNIDPRVEYIVAAE
jgi:hypothetical protein